MFKRHRDIYFEKRSETVISIILTTLATKAYARMVAKGSHPTLLEFAIRLVEDMPNHVIVHDVRGKPYFEVANPAVAGENFAEKWNSDPCLAPAFYEWQKRLVSDLRDFRNSTLLNLGTPNLVKKAARLYGEQAANLAANELAQRTSAMHRGGGMFITSGLGVGSTGVRAKPTSYYGR